MSHALQSKVGSGAGPASAQPRRAHARGYNAAGTVTGRADRARAAILAGPVWAGAGSQQPERRVLCGATAVDAPSAALPWMTEVGPSRPQAQAPVPACRAMPPAPQASHTHVTEGPPPASCPPKRCPAAAPPRRAGAAAGAGCAWAPPGPAAADPLTPAPKPPVPTPLPPQVKRRPDIQRIMIIGAGPIVIGQACEFDYSGTQACKSLK